MEIKKCHTMAHTTTSVVAAPLKELLKEYQSLCYTRAERCSQVSASTQRYPLSSALLAHHTLPIKAVSHVGDSLGLIVSPLIITVIHIGFSEH
jgi:hypothetical protein